MIFSKDNCPICETKLVYELVHRSVLTGSKYTRYFCRNTENVRNYTNTDSIAVSHYQHELYSGDVLSEMLFPPYSIFHSKTLDVTSIYLISPLEPKKYICSMPLLDMDYSQPQHVVSRVKLLVTFS